MKGATTLVAISELPSGSLSMSGFATSENSSFEKNASGTKTTKTAIVDLSSRSRSSSRCEISVPSASCSGSRLSELIGPARLRGGICGPGRRRGVNRLLRRRVAERVVLRFLFELRAQLPRHRARAPGPAAEIRGELRQALRAEHQERDPEDQDDLGKSDLEHRLRRWSCCCPTWRPRARRNPRPCPGP